MASQLLIDGKWTRQPRVTGVQRYAQGLVEALARTGLEFELLRPPAHPRLGLSAWEQLALPRRTRANDLLYCPANMAPLWLPRGVHSVVTLHCLRFLSHAENYSRAFVAWYRFAIPRVLARASAVLTVSHAMGLELEQRYPCVRGKLHVVYPGVDPAFQAAGARSELGVDGRPTWIFLGNALPAKNLITIARAAHATQSGARVALAGVEPSELARLDLGPAQQALIPLGHIDRVQELAAHVRSAIGLLAPSLYESFDFPLVEGMACGKPVLASDLPVHGEVAGAGARLLPATDVAAWTSAMDALAQDTVERKRLAAAGLERAAAFTWERAALSVRRVLETVGADLPQEAAPKSPARQRALEA